MFREAGVSKVGVLKARFSGVGFCRVVFPRVFSRAEAVALV